MCAEPGCGKAFAMRSYLKKHFRTHTGEKAFVCVELGCGKAFARAEDLRKHNLRLHIKSE
jgi:uncharacterized Zn-finger protein